MNLKSISLLVVVTFIFGLSKTHASTIAEIERRMAVNNGKAKQRNALAHEKLMQMWAIENASRLKEEELQKTQSSVKKRLMKDEIELLSNDFIHAQEERARLSEEATVLLFANFLLLQDLLKVSVQDAQTGEPRNFERLTTHRKEAGPIEGWVPKLKSILNRIAR